MENLKERNNLDASYLMFRTINYFYLILLFIFIGYYLIKKNASFDIDIYQDFAIIVTFILIATFSLFRIVSILTAKSISLNLIHWFFILLFFFFAPFAQYLSGNFRFDLSYEDILITNILILIWLVFYDLSYHKKYKKDEKPKPSIFVFRLTMAQLFILALLCIYIAFIILHLVGPEAFLTRGSRNVVISNILGGWKPLTYIIFRFLKPMVFIGFLFFLLYMFFNKKRSTLFWMLLISLGAVNIVINNPLGDARFYAFTLLFGLLVLFLIDKIRKGVFFFLVLVIGIPLSQVFDVFRLTTNLKGIVIRSPNFSSYILSGHFDSYENFVHTVNFVKENGIVFGKQMLGALLFFIPRAWWESKPIGTGSFVYQWLAKKYEVVHFNVANPLPSEFYINFGIFGIILGALLYGWLIAVLDKRFEQAQNMRTILLNSERVDAFYVLYPFLLGFFLFHLRGDFMSSFAYTTGFLLAFIVLMIIARVRIVIKSKR